MKFEKNCSYIGGGDTRPLQSDTLFFNLTVGYFSVKILYSCGENVCSFSVSFFWVFFREPHLPFLHIKIAYGYSLWNLYVDP